MQGNHGEISGEFCDTGKGMSPSILSHVFDPFISTKASGTGLGLSISHELLRAHGGHIHVVSQEDHGTSVRVTIPANPSTVLPEQLQADRT